MKRLLAVILATCSLIACSFAAPFAWADSAQPSLIRVKTTHPPVHRHRAHRAGRHHARRVHHRHSA